MHRHSRDASSTAIPKVVPAQLSFLAIYNPSLGSSEETFHQQIVFYYSKAAGTRSKRHGCEQAEQLLQERENEKLRQVGLAQGMVDFAKSFSSGETVDSVDTQKARVVLHEIESGWWMLASINLTALPAAKNVLEKTSDGKPMYVVEYTSREVSPPHLLIQQLVRAQSIFLLYHGSTLSAMFAKHDRTKFCSILDRYWNQFASNWDVLLHGSPAVDIFGGMKLAAGGELGMGVGEEEWGSSERDVLEDFARRTDGLFDVMVSRFGESSLLQEAKTSTDPKTLEVKETEPWLGSGKNIQAPDGVVFSGLGRVSRKSLRDLSHWGESLYSAGESAYGVRDNPIADRRKRRRKNPRLQTERSRSRPSGGVTESTSGADLPPRIPPPIVKTVGTSLNKALTAVDKEHVDDKKDDSAETPKKDDSKAMLASLGGTETWMKYMTLGYGTAWGGQKAENPNSSSEQMAPPPTPSPELMRCIDPASDTGMAGERIKMQIQQENDGYFLIGLKGNMQDRRVDDDNGEGDWNNRIPLRTLYIERDESAMDASIDVSPEATPLDEKDLVLESTTTTRLIRLRPVVYIHRPFIYIFLFHQRTDSLTIASFYRNLHIFFSPFHRTLDKSTSPHKVAARLAAAANPHTTIPSTQPSDSNTLPIYDLVFDPRTLSVHTSLPNIPDLNEPLSNTSNLSWTRVEALNVHSQILSTITSTRHSLSEIERTCKTSRGWWVVWMRLPPSHISSGEVAEALEKAQKETSPHHHQDHDALDPSGARGSRNASVSTVGFTTSSLRQAFLIRRARDAPLPVAKSAGRLSGVWSGLGLGAGSQSQRTGEKAERWESRGLAEGIGVDARRYVEELLSLNR